MESLRRIKQHLWPILGWAFVYLLALSLIDLVLFLMAHVPGLAGHLDSLLIFLTGLRRWMTWPRLFLRQLWWSETTPRLLSPGLAAINLLLWGGVIHFARIGWRKLRQSQR